MLNRRDMIATPVLIAASPIGQQGAQRSALESNQNGWDITPLVDSEFAGPIQIKWDSRTGESYHLSGTGVSQSTWLGALKDIRFVPITFADQLTDDRAVGFDRFQITPHIMFGDSQAQERERHAVFMIDTYTGKTYVLAVGSQAAPKFPFHDEFHNCFWMAIEEAPAEKPSPGAFKLSSVSPTHFRMIDGRLGPLLTRLSRSTGRMWVAIPKTLAAPPAPDAAFVWYPIPQ